MDRQISASEIRNSRIASAAKALGLVALLALAVWGVRQLITPSLTLDSVRVATVDQGPVVATISAAGNVVPRNEHLISSRLSAQIADVLIPVGTKVQAGDVLLQLDDASQRKAVSDLQEQLLLKENERDTTRLELEAKIDTAQGNLALAEIDLESRQAKLARMQQLVETGAVSAGDRQEAELEVKRALVNIEQLKKRIAHDRKQADATLKGIDLEAKILQNSLDEQRRLLAATQVVAPLDGVVTFLVDQIGTSVSPGDELARVADLDRFRVEARVSDFFARRLAPGMEVIVAKAGDTLPGRVSAVLPAVENGSVRMLIELENPSAQGLQSQQRVDVEIVTHRISNTLRLPNSSRLASQSQQDLFVVAGDRAERRSVQLGDASQNYIAVIAGLNKGDEVIVSDTEPYRHLESLEID